MHVVVAHLGHHVVLGALLPVGQALHLLYNRLTAFHVDASLEVNLQPSVVRARVEVALGEAALVQARPSLAVREGERALERTSHWLRASSEHGEHLRVPSNVLTEGLER